MSHHPIKLNSFQKMLFKIAAKAPCTLEMKHKTLIIVLRITRNALFNFKVYIIEIISGFTFKERLKAPNMQTISGGISKSCY